MGRVTNRLFWGVPFAGYETPYLERFTAAFGAAAEGTGAEALWYYNGADGAFAKTLAKHAKAMPIRVKVLWESLPVLGNTDAIIKNNAVAIAHARTQYELRRRDPAALLFMHESDVIVPPGGIAQLVEGLKAHPALGALSGAIPEWRTRDPIYVGTMAWRIQPRHEGSYTPPGGGPVVGWYLPEMTKGIEMCDAVPFGALLARLSVFEQVPLATRMFPGLGVDQEWSQNMLYAGKMPVAVDWGVWCGHYRRDFNPAWEDIRERMTTGVSATVGLAP